MATSTKPSLTATADPELEPHGFKFLPYEFNVCPPKLDHPETDPVDLKFAHSDKLVLPIIK